MREVQMHSGAKKGAPRKRVGPMTDAPCPFIDGWVGACQKPTNFVDGIVTRRADDAALNPSLSGYL